MGFAKSFSCQTQPLCCIVLCWGFDKKRKYALVGSSWGIEEGAPDLGLDLWEYEDVTL